MRDTGLVVGVVVWLMFKDNMAIWGALENNIYNTAVCHFVCERVLLFTCERVLLVLEVTYSMRLCVDVTQRG